MEFDAMREYLLACGDEPETVWIEGGTFDYLYSEWVEPDHWLGNYISHMDDFEDGPQEDTP